MTVVFLVLAATSGLGARAIAQCVDYEADAMEYIGEYPTGGQPYGLSADGNLLYVANGTAGLAVLDIENRTLPDLLGAVDTPGTVRHVAIEGTIAVVAAYEAGLGIIDISNPKNPVVISFVDTPGNASQVAVRADVAYVADRDEGLSVFDIADRANPHLIGRFDTPGSAIGLAIDGDRVFIADRSNGLMILDVSTPAAPRLLGWSRTLNNAWGVRLSGNLAVVSDTYGGLTLVDVTDASLPKLIGNTADGDFVGGLPLDAMVDHGVAFVAAASAGLDDSGSALKTYDVTDPTHPKLIGAIRTGGSPQGVALCGDYAYVAVGARGIAIVDVRTRTSPHVLDATGNGAEAIDVAPHCAVVVASSGSFRTYDVTRSHDIRLLGSLYTESSNEHVSITGTLACVGTRDDKLKLVDIGDPVHPAMVGLVSMPPGINGVTTAGDYAYVALASRQLCIVDVSSPSAASITGVCVLPAPAHDVDVSGRYAYVALSGGTCLAVVDVADPAGPVLVGELKADTDAYWVTVDGSLAYLSRSTGGLLVVDVSDPSRPRVVSTVPVASWAGGLAVSGHYAYLADGLDGIQVIDVSNAAAARTMRHVSTPSWCDDVTILGDCVYASGGNAGLVAIPLQCDASLPVRLPEFTIEAWGTGIRLSWRCGPDAVTSGYLVWRETPGTSRQLLTPAALVGRTAYEVLDGAPPVRGADYWLEELPQVGASIWYGPLHGEALAPRAPLRLEQNAPNPFNPTTLLSYDLSRPGHVLLTVHDLRGARIATLMDADQPAGSHAVEWDGSGLSGEAAPSGVYIARLETSYGVRAVKLTLAR